MAQFGLRLESFQVRIFFCAFLTWIKHIFYLDRRSSEVQCNGGAARITQPRCQLKGLKVCYLLEVSFYLCRDLLPLLSGEVYFGPLSPCFCVEPSTIWSDIMSWILDWAFFWVLRQVNWTICLTSWWVKLLLFSRYNHLLLQMASLDRSKYYECGPLRMNLCRSRLLEFALMTLKRSRSILTPLPFVVCLM